ncbi:Cysteine proteinase [Pleurostoma richardsiae]|uniref:Cysteine proteinase n=1 Tax=Pleurostoma richardsiae TaxID=41990 RepID=A0AA38R844_9PEZI|nr:Cysteine proteinase [Pleurostoma richardsiae]
MDFVYGDAPAPAPPPATTSKNNRNKTPQELVSEFWDKFVAKKTGKVTSIFPRSLYATLLPPLKDPRGTASARNAAESYEAAAKECREKVKRVVRECNRTNERFTDPDFDIESDPDHNCLNGLIRGGNGDDAGSGDAAATAVSPWELKNSLNTLVSSQLLGPETTVPVNVANMGNFIGGADASLAALFGSAATTARGGRSRPRGGTRSGPKGGVRGDEFYWPGAVHRLEWIFEKPQFTIDGYSSSDIQQGANGDCWWLAAVATIAHRRDLMERVCVARDEECGVYGFVFQREGEWVHTVVDDNLYLSQADFSDANGDEYDPSGKKARKYRKMHQTGSEALYFSKCADQNETWLPLLEKAYSKIHGDYEAVSGGWSGEAVEDMTGGVTTTVATRKVLKKDRLWRELVNASGDFVFALSAIGTGWEITQNGLYMGHAYSILKATEEVDEDGNKVRLVQIRNPWGQRDYSGLGEWMGPWSDGSKEWTPYWLKKLGHTFGDDGVFWMSYEDVLETFLFLHRTRLFDEKWTVVSQWTGVNVSWVTGYLQTKFVIEVKKAGMVVIVLTQLDDRYFQGFEGQYEFALHFLLQEENASAGEHICRVRPVHSWEKRSVSCEVELEPGRYEVLPKVTATRDKDKPAVEAVVKEWAEKNPQKLRQVGMLYDLAHAKGGVPDEDKALEAKRAEEKRKKELAKKKRKEEEKKAREQAKAAEEAPQKPVSAGEEKAEVNNEEKKVEPEEKKDGDAGKENGVKDEDKDKFEDASETPEKPADKEETSKEEKAEPLPGAAPGEKKGDPDDKKQDDKEEEKKKDDEGGEDSDSESEAAPEDETDSRPPWNAVCVLGLRVYAQDSDVAITLVKPKDAEEGAILSVDSVPAGATM